jgi:dipeptidyl aminopeptidase/acylaminoacyl peptidase
MRIVLAVSAMALALLPVAVAARTMQVSDLRAIVGVSDPDISPDGAQIAFIVSRSDYAANDTATELAVVDIASGAQRTLVQGRRDIASPRWSPDGKSISFIARAGEQDQLMLVAAGGGAPRQMTDARNGVTQFAWSPDGATLAFVTADVPKNQTAIDQHHDSFEVSNDSYLTTAVPTSAHLWLVPAAGGPARRLTSGDWTVTGGDYVAPLSWSPDGRYILISKSPSPHLGDYDDTVQALIDTRDGHPRQLTQHSGYEGYGVFSPDGGKVAYWYPKDGDPLNGSQIYVAPTQGGNGADVTSPLDRDIARAIWMPDGATLLIGATDGTRVFLWLQPFDGPARKLDLGEINPSWSNWVDVTVGRNGSIAFGGAEPKRPTELYYMSSPTAKVRRLTDFNHDIAALELGTTETISWRTTDGMTADGLLTYPPDYVKGKRYPLLVRIHGGPNLTSTTEFYDFAQVMAAHGYLVFRPNYRGSDNLGNAYEHAIFNDAGVGPAQDIMGGIQVVQAMGLVDDSKIAVGGISYGGFMTAWLVGHYSIFKADVMVGAELDALEQYDLGDYNVAEWYYFKGSPWVRPEHLDAYRAQSPISYVSQIKTPTLIVSNAGDERVPITQSYAMFHALRDNSVPVKFVVFPGDTHEIEGPVHIEDYFQLWLDWLGTYLK